LKVDIHKPLLATRPVPELYKFSSLAGERLDWFEGILVRGEFYFAHPDELNDPFEFRPRFVMPSGNPELLKFKLRQFLRANGVRTKELKRMPQRPLYEVVQLMNEKWRSPSQTRLVQMFCMSSVRGHPLLWAHYADGHRGACLHLDMRYVPLAAALIVCYSEEYPPISLLDRPDREDTFRRLVLTKGLEWKYEGEYRVIRHLESPTGHLDVAWKGQLALASPEAVCGVTLGARISAEDQDAVMRMVKARKTPIPIWRARPDGERFAFNFERIE
jgi:hypothetical protein